MLDQLRKAEGLGHIFAVSPHQEFRQEGTVVVDTYRCRGCNTALTFFYGPDDDHGVDAPFESQWSSAAEEPCPAWVCERGDDVEYARMQALDVPAEGWV